mgnify:CR=1 FL=1
MMKYLLASLLIILLVFSSLQAKTIKLPTYTIEAVINMAREYAKEQSLINDRHYLKKIEYHEAHSEYRTPYWLAEYHLAAGSIKTAGGQIFIKILNDGKISHTFGE